MKTVEHSGSRLQVSRGMRRIPIRFRVKGLGFRVSDTAYKCGTSRHHAQYQPWPLNPNPLNPELKPTGGSWVLIVRVISRVNIFTTFI